MADSIDIVVGATDKASSILRSIADQTEVLSGTLTETKQNADEATLSIGNLSVAAAALATAYGALKAGAAFADMLGKSSQEFVALEQASRKLEPALKDLARSIEIGTNVDEKTIFGLMKRAKAEGFATDQIDDATKAAIGLAEVMEISVTEAMAKVKSAAEGNFTAFEVLIPGINQLATQEEKLAAVSELATEGLQNKKTAADAAVAVFDRMNVEMSNLYATIGEILEPFRQLAYGGISVLAELLSQALTPAVEDFRGYFANMANTVNAAAKSLTENIVSGFTFVEVVVTNIGTVFEMAGMSILLALEQMRSSAAHTLTVAIPEYAAWFAENFMNIIRDLAVGATTIIQNLGSMLGEAFFKIFTYIMGGWQEQGFDEFLADLGGTLSKSLLEGFEPTTEALPDIGERAVSELERSLQEGINVSAEQLATEYDTKLNERLSAINQGIRENTLDAEVNIQAKPGASLQGIQTEAKVLQAVESRVLVRGSTEDPLVNISQQQLTTLQDMLNELRQREQLINFEGVQ